ncbi:MAG: hypothetical protein ABGY75_21010 [Gemmataceae bacterium]
MRTTIVLLLVLPALFAEPPKFSLTTSTLDPPKELSDAVKPLLGADAVTVANAGGDLITLWFRTELTSTANAEQVKNGLTYREIAEGTLLGAVRFDKPFVDFRKQDIPAGVYTLRLAVQPDTGDHRDTAPHQDFALLVPAAADLSAEPVELKELVKLSLKSTGGDHPGVLLLFPHHGKEEKPELADLKDGVKTVRLRRPVTTSDGKASLGIAVVVHGVSKTR